MSQHKTRWSKSGQPVLGTVLRLPQTDGEFWPAKVVGQIYGRGGNADLVGIVVEAVDDGERYKFSWPLTQGDRQCTRDELTWA